MADLSATLRTGLAHRYRLERELRRRSPPRRRPRLSGHGASSIGLLGYAHGAAGRPDEARSVLERLMTLSGTRYISQYDAALIHLVLGEADSAVQWLERGYAERDHQMVFLKVDPRLDGLRERADFGRLLANMRF